MKKIILVLIIVSSFVNAGKIFLEYTFDMNKSDIPGLKEVKDNKLATKPLKLYRDDYNQDFLFIDNKLKIVHLIMDNVNLKESIEKTLKSGFRLKKIIAKTKYGKQKINNVGELLKLVDKITIESIVFDSFIDTELQFEQNDAVIIMTYKKYMRREESGCIKCDEINGKISKEYEILEYFFTEKDKKDTLSK